MVIFLNYFLLFLAPLTTFSAYSYYTTATTYLIDVLDSAVTPQSLAIGTSPISGSSTVVFSNQQGGATNSKNCLFINIKNEKKITKKDN